MSPRPLANRHVLVVEDEPLIALNLRYAFEDAGAVVTVQHAVEPALAFFDAAREEGDLPDVAVLDVSLGRGTTCMPVAEQLTRARVPFVLHSGNLDRVGELIERLQAPVIPKPAPDIALVQAVADLVGERGDAPAP